MSWCWHALICTRIFLVGTNWFTVSNKIWGHKDMTDMPSIGVNCQLLHGQAFAECDINCVFCTLNSTINRLMLNHNHLFTSRGPCYYSGLTLSPAWINNRIPSKVCDEITYPFPNLNGCIVEIWERKSNFTPHFIVHVITYPCWDYN